MNSFLAAGRAVSSVQLCEKVRITLDFRGIVFYNNRDVEKNAGDMADILSGPQMIKFSLNDEGKIAEIATAKKTNFLRKKNDFKYDVKDYTVQELVVHYNIDSGVILTARYSYGEIRDSYCYILALLKQGDVKDGFW